MTKLVNRIVQVAFHRNGICGEPFHAVVFTSTHERCAVCKGLDSMGWTDGSGKPAHCVNCRKPTEVEVFERKMLGIVFDKPSHVAVVSIDLLNDPEIGVAFGENSWRGDRYEPELRAAIAAHDSDGSVRVGPFAIPTKRKGKRS